MDLFIYTSSNYMYIRSHLISQTKNKLISISEQLFNATVLLPIIFGVILTPNQRGTNSTNSQNNLETSVGNKNSKACTIKIILGSGATSASIIR